LSPDASSRPADDAYYPHDIVILPTWAHIRKRPGIYIGSCDQRGLFFLLEALLIDFFFAEVLAGRCTRIELTLLPAEGYCLSGDCVEWAGRGHSGSRSWVEFVCTEPGVPSFWAFPIANALTQDFHFEVHRKGERWRQAFSYGRPCGPFQPAGESSWTGIQLTFWPDSGIFKDGRELPAALLAHRFRELAALHRGLQLHLIDRRGPAPYAEVFRCEEGLADHVRFLNQGRTPLHEDVIIAGSEETPSAVEAALQWTEGEGGEVLSWVNGVPARRGTHLEGFRRALTLACGRALRGAGLRESGRLRLDCSDCEAGLTAALAVTLGEPQWTGATKETLLNEEAMRLVQRPLYRTLTTFFNKHPDKARAIIARIHAAHEARCQRAAMRRSRRR
jgi:DNA gyrase subunit B